MFPQLSQFFLVQFLIINLEGHQNRIIGSKVTAILLSGWILPIGGVALERVCHERHQPHLLIMSVDFGILFHTFYTYP